MGCYDGSKWLWVWVWRRPLFAWESHLLEEMVLILGDRQPATSNQDRWLWLPGANLAFSVKSAYTWLQNNTYAGIPYTEVDPHVFESIWSTLIPPKVRIFVWRLVQYKLPTRFSLSHRGIISSNSDIKCAFCSIDEETSDHLFFACPVASFVWYKVYDWIGLSTVLPLKPVDNFLQFELPSDRKMRKHLKYLIWGATVWVLWNHRNHIVFQGVQVDKMAMLAHLKYISWSWVIMRKENVSRDGLDVWLSDPVRCLSSVNKKQGSSGVT